MNGHLTDLIDVNYLNELLGYLKEATGFGVLLVNPEDPSDISSEQRCTECPLCALVHSTDPGREHCSQEFLQAGSEALRWGEPYFYHCYLGLMEWAIPIVLENELIGILTCGQVLIQGKDDLFYERVLSQTKEFGLSPDTVNQAIEGVPVVSGRKVRAAAELLRLVAERLSEQVGLNLLEARSRQQQQAEIAEALVAQRQCVEGTQDRRRLQREIIGRVRIGDLTGAKRLLNDLLGAVLLRSTIDMAQLKAEALELAVMLSRAAVEAGADLQQILGDNLVLLGDLLERQSQEDISHWILKILENFTNSVFRTRNLERVKMISDGLEYIRTHYSENITLDDVSQEVGRSSSYFKKILREEMGFSFTEYLTRTRLEAAEQLLRDPQFSLTEIAQMVGYNDQSYFGKIFKHYHGLTPAQYRKKVL